MVRATAGDRTTQCPFIGASGSLHRGFTHSIQSVGETFLLTPLPHLSRRVGADYLAIDSDAIRAE